MAKQFNIKIHMSLKKRKLWGHKMRLIFLALIVVLCLCGVCFYFGAVTWDPEVEPAPVPGAQEWWQWLLIAVGAIVAVGSIVGFTLFSYYEMRRFYTSQLMYFNTPEFAKAKANALKVDLVFLKKKDLKWYKNMGYITKAEKTSILDQQKKLKQEYKDKNKKWVWQKPKLEQEDVIKNKG